ncbi:hypothetical protein BGZ60DRAFT_2530 [Tricladium varicosporioides]|nr:hypothetical protein BGZ60DRAFT_2530 [Hymenoscyphus varicosporioides]
MASTGTGLSTGYTADMVVHDIEEVDCVEELKSTSGIAGLPNELLCNIFHFLDSPKPSSSSKLHDEPSFEITFADNADLKSASCVSKLWRQATIPILFTHARFILSDPRGPQRPTLSNQIWPFLEFVQKKKLRDVLTTFTLQIQDKTVANKKGSEYRLYHFSAFWHTLFKIINPIELLIVAPAAALGVLTDCHVILEDAWSFDCPCQYLRLRRQPDPIPSTTEKYLEECPDISGIEAPPKPPEMEDRTGLRPWEYRRAISSAIFDIRPWTAMLLNEGSFVRAYATYEFWQRQAPSILHDLVGAEDPDHESFITPTIRDLEYIGIFPMSRHITPFTENLPRLDRLYMQIVPRNEILQNKDKMIQVEQEDLWMERNSCYAAVMRELFSSPPTGNFQYLEVFESGDAADRDAWLMAGM